MICNAPPNNSQSVITRFVRCNLKGQNNILLGDSMCERDAYEFSQKWQFVWNLTFLSSYVFFYLFRIILSLCMCVSVCHTCTNIHRGQNMVLNTLELWVILMCVLGTKLGFSKRVGSIPNHWAISPGSFFFFQCQKHYTKVGATIQYTPWLNEVKTADSIFHL